MAKVLTPEEIMALPDRQDNIIPVVIEKKVPFQIWDNGSIVKWASSDFAKEQYEDTLILRHYEWYTYGKTMRIWDGLPTFEEREATPWES